MQPLTTIRTGDPRELLALIPFQLGFHPQESAVVVSLRGRRSRVGLVARVDLDDLADRAEGSQVARSLVRHLVTDGASSVVLVLYTDQDVRSRAGSPVASRARAHLEQAAEHFVGRAACWVVGSEGYFNLDCVDPSCCPPQGRPLSGLQSTEVGAQMVLNGTMVAVSRDDLVQLEAADPDARRSARRAATRWTARGPLGAQGGVDPGAAHRWRREGLALWRSELERATVSVDGSAEGRCAVGTGADRGPGTPEPATSVTLGRLQAALSDVLVRDAVMLTFIEGAGRVADRVVAGAGAGAGAEAGDPVGAALRAVIDPAHGVPPRRDVHTAATLVLRQIVSHSARRLQAPGLTLLAVLAWWDGDGARAGILVDRALAAEPGYRLAGLLHETLLAGMAPGWLRRREA